MWHIRRAEPLWTGRKEGKLANSAGATSFTHEHLLSNSYRLSILGAASGGSKPTCAFCCTKRQAAATRVFMPCDLATKADELKRADHGGYIHVSRRLLT